MSFLSKVQIVFWAIFRIFNKCESAKCVFVAKLLSNFRDYIVGDCVAYSLAVLVDN